MGLIIPKCNADPETLDLTLKVYYDAKDWVENSTLIDNLSMSLIDAGIETEKKEPQSYTKKTQVLSYYGFLEWEDPSDNRSKRRITDIGKVFYELRRDNKQDEILQLLINVLATKTFGRNVLGCDSDSDLEAPNIFIKSAMLLQDFTKKEFAYILQKMEFENTELFDCIFDVSLKRKARIKIEPNADAIKWVDPKPILALGDWGMFNVSKNGQTDIYNLSKDVVERYSDRLLALRTKNSEPIRFRTINIIDRLNDDELNLCQISYLPAIRTKPFILLAGISGTGKSRIVRKLAQATDDIDSFANDAERFSCHTPANFCLIQVKPNWHNSMDVVGFKSNIGGEHYEYTPFIEFIAKAWQHQNTPFFLCLDEMNLAPVEEYFAEFLSAIESRSVGSDGEYETDPIIKPFDGFGEKVRKDMLDHLIGTVNASDIDANSEKGKMVKRFREKGLTLPKNLIVMGTVNMDETTFSFSRKVLDRAMSIEMNEVNYDEFLNGTTDNDIPVLVDRNHDLVERFVKAQQVKDFIDAEEVKNFLVSVNALLEGTPFKLGYRAANEAMLYVAAAKTFGNDNLASALDDFTMMKILSRIEGDESKLRTKDGDELLDKLYELFEKRFSGLGKSKTLTKLEQMQHDLKRDHFVSFWG